MTVTAVAAILLVVAALLAFLVDAILANDEADAVQEREAVRAFLSTHATHMQQVLKTTASMAKLDKDATSVSESWFQSTFGRPLNDQFGFEQSVLVDSAGNVLYASNRGEPVQPEALAQARPALSALVWAAEHQSGAHSGIVRQGPVTGVAAVEPVGEPDAADGPSGRRRIYAVTVDLLNADLFRELGRTFKPAAFKLVEGIAPKQDNGVAVADLADGRALSVTWPPARPGRALLARVAPPVALLSSTLLLMCGVLLVQTRRTARALARSEAEANALAAQDALTGLANRGHFIAALDRSVSDLAEGETLALLFLDLDGFKDINDTLGHAAGDTLLRIVAARLQGCVGGDSLVARFGGDEFVLMAWPDGQRRLPDLMEGILAAMRAPMAFDGVELQVGASIGAAVAPIDAATGPELMRLADIALYRAKAEGRGSAVRFEPSFEREVRRRRTIELELASAIDTGQLALVYQPQVDVENERIVGFEALVRWDHPRRGRLMPGDFLPVVEGTPLITRLDDWVLRNACLQARDLAGVTLAVNMSPVSLRTAGIADHVVQALETAGFDPQRLEIEITESAIIGTDRQVNEALTQLRAIGVRLALDDFGTGHASLVHVRRFPITKIKIDRSFISNLGVERDAAAIVEYVVRLGRSLGITLTAEGVETREQLRFLRAFGAQQAQGYLFSPPLPLAAAAALLERNREMLGSARRASGREGARHPV